MNFSMNDNPASGEQLWWLKTRIATILVVALCAILPILAWQFTVLLDAWGGGYPVGTLFALLGVPFIAWIAYGYYLRRLEHLDSRYDMGDNA